MLEIEIESGEAVSFREISAALNRRKWQMAGIFLLVWALFPRIRCSRTRGYDRSQLMSLGNATAEYDDLTRTRKKAEENHLLYAKQTEEARIAESLHRRKIANVAIAEQPIESHLPAKPNVMLNLSLGFLLAGFVNMGAGFTAEYMVQPGRGARASVESLLAESNIRN